MTTAMKSKLVLATFALGLWAGMPAIAADKAAEKPAAEKAAPAGDDAVATAIAGAKKAQKKAASVNGEWRDIGKFIKKAEEAAKGGNSKKALKLAKKATSQSELGHEQAKNQEKLAKEFPDYLK